MIVTNTTLHQERLFAKSTIKGYILNKEPFTFDSLCEEIFFKGASPHIRSFILDFLSSLEKNGYLDYDAHTGLWITKAY